MAVKVDLGTKPKVVADADLWSWQRRVWLLECQGGDDLSGRHNVPACDIISSIWLERGGIICPL